jgi:hypothetical protein
MRRILRARAILTPAYLTGLTLAHLNREKQRFWQKWEDEERERRRKDALSMNRMAWWM